jgi:hypothetical protein
VAIVVAMAQVAEAQREGGRRGGRFGRGGGISSVQLVSQSEEVQAALNLTEEQKGKAEEINDQFRDDVRDLFQAGGGGGFPREEMQKLNQETSAKLAEILDEAQQKKLMGILIQVNGANALFDSSIAKELTITEDQRTSLAEVRDENRQAMRDADDESEDLTREERRAKDRELRAEADKKLLAVLTTDQQSQYEALKLSEPIEIDTRGLFRGFGGRGFGGGRGNRDRGDRDNDDGDNDGV